MHIHSRWLIIHESRKTLGASMGSYFLSKFTNCFYLHSFLRPHYICTGSARSGDLFETSGDLPGLSLNTTQERIKRCAGL